MPKIKDRRTPQTLRRLAVCGAYWPASEARKRCTKTSSACCSYIARCVGLTESIEGAHPTPSRRKARIGKAKR